MCLRGTFHFSASRLPKSACGDSDHSAAAQKGQGENKRLLESASAGEQYHAEGLYKDRSAFIPRSYNGSTALKREKVRGG